MNLILTSDFPGTPTPGVAERMRAVTPNPRIVWIPPFTDPSGAALEAAREGFARDGFAQVEVCDIDEDRDDVQIAYLHEFDVIFLGGGDPVRFRYNAIRTGLSGRLRQCASIGRLIVGAGGGASLLTPNVSVSRLESESLEAVLATRARYDSLGAVPYELFPHVNRYQPPLLERVRAYSAHVDNDVLALADGAAVFHIGDEAVKTTGGLTQFRGGEVVAR